MATHSNTLAWKIPWTEEPGRLQSMGSRRIRHDGTTSLSLFTLMRWIRKWQPTPEFLPGESQGRWRLVGCRLCGRTESDTTERLSSSSSSRGPCWVTVGEGKRRQGRAAAFLVLSVQWWGARRHEKEPSGLREQEPSLRGGRASPAQSLLGGCLLAGMS